MAIEIIDFLYDRMGDDHLNNGLRGGVFLLSEKKENGGINLFSQ